MSTILVIDDSPTVVMHFSGILQGAGYDVATAANGQEGINQIDAGLKPSIILTDLNMPDMDGVAFIKAARRTATTRFTPIIVLSSDTDGRRRDAARAFLFAAAPPGQAAYMPMAWPATAPVA